MRMEEAGTSRTRNKSTGQRQPSKQRAEAQAVAPQRRASWGSKERPAIATSTKPHVNGRPTSAPQTARNGTPASKTTHGTPSRSETGASPPVHRVARQILASSPAQDVIHINLEHPITSYISPSQSSVSSKVPSPASPKPFLQDGTSTHQPDEAELLRAEVVELKRSFQAREAQLVQQVESLCSQLAAANCAREAAEAEVKVLRSELAAHAEPRKAEPHANNGMKEEMARQGAELLRLQQAFDHFEAQAAEREERLNAERSHVLHLEELLRSQQSQQQQFCSDLQALWAKVSTARCEVRPRPEVASEASQPVRLRTGEEQVNDMAANVLLRNIYSAVSELP